MRPEKQFLLDDIKNQITDSQAIVLTSYARLEPNAAASFRSNLAKAGGSMEVVKKRILLKAMQSAGVELDPAMLKGHIAIVFANTDPVQTTKLIYQFSDEHEKVLKILGGRFEGSICSAQDIEQISKLPGKDEMRAQFLATLEAPLSQTLAVIEALLTSVMHCLDNKAEQE